MSISRDSLVIARYPLNWQLRQAGLRAIAELKRPCDEVIQVSVQIMMDETNDLETRILAGHAVSGVLRIGNGTISERTRSEAATSIRDLLAQPQLPVLHAFAQGLGRGPFRNVKGNGNYAVRRQSNAGYRFGFARRRAPGARRPDG